MPINDGVRKFITGLSNDDLAKYVRDTESGYSEEAIGFARAEIARRTADLALFKRHQKRGASALRPAAGPSRLPRPVAWLAAFGLITAGLALYYTSAFESFGTRDAYDIYDHITSWLVLPLYLALTAASIGVIIGRDWARILMLRWALVATIYELLQTLVVVLWIGYHATPADLGLEKLAGDAGMSISDLTSSLQGFLGDNYLALTVQGTALTELISILSLTSYAYWVLTRPAVRNYFKAKNAATPPIPQVSPPQRQA
jgi:hypothetical protein